MVGPVHDIAIVGAGVVGCAVARHLARAGASVVVLDRAADVGDGTSKANTAILHSGFDTEPDSLESALVRRGRILLADYAAAAGIAVEPTGALLVAWDDEQEARLPSLLAKAVTNGSADASLVGADEVRDLEPHLGPDARSGLSIPGEWAIDPWSVTLAFATEAAAAGAELRLGAPVVGVEVGRRGPRDPSGRRDGAGPLAGQCGRARRRPDRRTARPPRLHRHAPPGSVDRVRQAGPPAARAGSCCRFRRPGPKGCWWRPPPGGTCSSARRPRTWRTGTTRPPPPRGSLHLLAAGRRILPDLVDEEVTASYAGLRAATEHRDYQIRLHGDQRFVSIGGIRSTGLTSSMAVAEHVADLLAGAGATWSGPPVDVPTPHMPPLGELQVRPSRDPVLIAADPAYGTVLCHCEQVSRGEVRDACHAPVPATDLGGVRRRTRAMNGRCQGFYCGAEVVALVAAETGIDPGRADPDAGMTDPVVLVVGAGPAGLSAARELAARGVGPVLVVDREVDGRWGAPPLRPHRIRRDRPAPVDVRSGLRPAAGRPGRRGRRRPATVDHRRRGDAVTERPPWSVRTAWRWCARRWCCWPPVPASGRGRPAWCPATVRPGCSPPANSSSGCVPATAGGPSCRRGGRRARGLLGGPHPPPCRGDHGGHGDRPAPPPVGAGLRLGRPGSACGSRCVRRPRCRPCTATGAWRPSTWRTW